MPDSPTPPTLGRPRLADFSLSPDFIHCNQGSYGALPRAVQAAQDQWRARINTNPSGFFFADYPGLVRRAADEVSEFLGGESKDWVFVENVTAATSAVLSGLDLRPGDTLLTTSHAYGAVRKALDFFAERAGARVVAVPIPAPVDDTEAIIQPIRAALAAEPNVRAAFLDHVTSPSGIVFPVQALTALCREHAVPVFIDGAHAPGMLELDVPALGADWYVGNAHKWLFAPLGCGLFWCRSERQATTRPAVISHGINEGFTNAFDWIGTRDPSAWLSIGAAIAYYRSFPGLRDRNHGLAVQAGATLAAEFGTETAAPPAMMGALATIRLPVDRSFDQVEARRLMVEIQERDRAVAVFTVLDERLWLRLSGAIYNDLEDLLETGRIARRMVLV